MFNSTDLDAVITKCNSKVSCLICWYNWTNLFHMAGVIPVSPWLRSGKNSIYFLFWTEWSGFRIISKLSLLSDPIWQFCVPSEDPEHPEEWAFLKNLFWELRFQETTFILYIYLVCLSAVRHNASEFIGFDLHIYIAS